MAEAMFHQSGVDCINGSVFFSQMGEGNVRVDVKLENVLCGIHGMHIHERPVKFSKLFKTIFANGTIKSFRIFNNDVKQACKKAGKHFNGSMMSWSTRNINGTPHGSWEHNTERHVGDLCNNIEANMFEEVNFSYIDNLISLIPNHPHCIVGRSIIITRLEDDRGFLKYEPRTECRTTVDNITLLTYTPSNKELIESNISGNGGKGIACANIEYV